MKSKNVYFGGQIILDHNGKGERKLRHLKLLGFMAHEAHKTKVEIQRKIVFKAMPKTLIEFSRLTGGYKGADYNEALGCLGESIGLRLKPYSQEDRADIVTRVKELKKLYYKIKQTTPQPDLLERLYKRNFEDMRKSQGKDSKSSLNANQQKRIL